VAEMVNSVDKGIFSSNQILDIIATFREFSQKDHGIELKNLSYCSFTAKSEINGPE
jgi:hypothetical protein